MKEKIQFFLKDKNTRILIAAFLFVGFFLLVSTFFDGQKIQKENEIYSADTIIPKGFVLVPIELQNLESLSSLIGSYGIIDLFTTPQLNQKSGRRVGRRLKLIRAPLNPQTFAVLVPENEATEILSANGPFVAVVQNPDSQNNSQVLSQHPIHKIEYFKGAKK